MLSITIIVDTIKLFVEGCKKVLSLYTKGDVEILYFAMWLSIQFSFTFDDETIQWGVR